MQDIHTLKYVKELFNEMSQTYGIVNILSSLGFKLLFPPRMSSHAIKTSPNHMDNLILSQQISLYVACRVFGKSTDHFE